MFAREAGAEATGMLVFAGAAHALIDASGDADLLVVSEQPLCPSPGLRAALR